MAQPETGADAGESQIVRVPSHVPGLDAILCGGFLQGGLYMVQGQPGAGKTLLVSQILYGHAAAGSRSLFVTVLGESHGRLLLHMEMMRFFDPSAIPDKVAYISAYHALEDEGLKGLATLIRREVLSRGTTILVLDGASAVEGRAESGFEMKRFTHELQTLASATGCTMFLLTTTDAMSAPERTMVDGIIELRQQRHSLRNERRVLVRKIRGTAFLEGEHPFRITSDGLTVFPRIEALFAKPSRLDPPPTRSSVVRGGLARCDVRRRRSSRRHHDRAGRSFRAPARPPWACTSCPLRAPTNPGCCSAATKLRSACGSRPRRWASIWPRPSSGATWRCSGIPRASTSWTSLPIGCSTPSASVGSGAWSSTACPASSRRRSSRNASCASGLRCRTSCGRWASPPCIPWEMPTLVGVDIRPPGSEISALAEAMVLLRYVELRSRLCRLVSLSKVREGAFDPTIREFSISDTGVVVGKPFEGVEAGLDQAARNGAEHPAATSSGGTGLPP